MRKYLVVWLLAAQIGTVGVMSALVAPTAVAADAKFSKAVGTPLKAAQEAIQNALRHAEANELRLRLAATDGRIELTVSDDGVGFDPTAPAVRSRRLGLTSMEERARALGGKLTIESTPGSGTTVRLEVAQ